MKVFYVICFLLFVSFKISYAQNELFYMSIQGTWDQRKDSGRAQFGGNNSLIYNYFRSYGKALIFGGNHVNGIAEITFKVTEEGSLDSVRFNSTIGEGYDRLVHNILLLSDGKWKPDEVNGVKQSEVITLWVNIYKETQRGASLEDCISKGYEFVEKKDFTMALKYSDKALIYDRLNLKALKLKINSLIGLNQNEKAIKLLNDSKKYNSEYFNDIKGITAASN